MNNVIASFIKNINDTPSAPAINCREKLYSYHEIGLLVTTIRNQLPVGQPLIGVVTGDDVYTYSAILAILSIGSAYVPLNYKNPENRNKSIIEESSLKTIITSGNIDFSEMEQVKIIRVSDSIQSGHIEIPVIDIYEDQLAYLFFTSGSTGKPKGVPVSHGNLNAFIDNILVNEEYDFSAADRFLQMFELSFDLSVMSFLVPMCLGASCYVVPDKGVQYFQVIKMLEEQKITVALMVPSILVYLKPYFEEIELPALRYSLFCGEALYQNLAESWQPCVPNAKIENVYGPTEATIYFTRYKWIGKDDRNEAVNGVVPIGKPMVGLKTYIVDENNHLVADGITGELCLWGKQVASGYWKNEELSKKSFIDIEGLSLDTKVYKTGDLCFVNENGNLSYCGRVDNQVKIDGYRVELGEIEHFAKMFSNKDNVVAIAVANENGNNVIHLFIENYYEDLDLLIEKLKQKLPAYMIPEKINVIDEMPYNLSGKVDRNKLKAIANNSIK